MGSKAIWTEETMTVGDAFAVSLSGLATVFIALIALALALVVIAKILDAMGISKKANAKPAQAARSNVSKSVTSSAASQKPQEEELDEYAAIIAAVSEHSRVPIERLKIVSINKR